jgi:hypothetical protein
VTIAGGFDVTHAFDAHAVGAALAIPALATAPQPRAILVGNTRAWWPIFLAARVDEHDPIDRFVERSLPDALYAHRCYDAGYLPFQRIAVAAGLGTLSPTQLVIHPIYGPWFALRAIVFEPGDPPPPPIPLAPICHCTRACTDAFAAACASSDPFAWIAVRDACTHGRAHRYDDRQIRYHYGKQRADLE